ncbi:MAG: hypothetical protein WC282_02955, partial [Bacilli bacterium]
MKKITKIGGLLLVSMLAYSCDGSTSDTSSLTSGSEDSTPISVSEIEDYDVWLNSWSENNHLYIHYLRPNASSIQEYSDYAIWIWQNAPQDLEGSIYCASNSEVQNLFHEMSTDWMNSIGGTSNNILQSGRIADINLSASDVVGGKTGNTTGFDGATRIGFLIVQQDSMDGGTHWTSDGGANTYISDLASHKRANGSIHVFCVQGSVGEYTFSYNPDYVENPVVSDTTGIYRSLADLDSSLPFNQTVTTSSTFKSSMGIG